MSGAAGTQLPPQGTRLCQEGPARHTQAEDSLISHEATEEDEPKGDSCITVAHFK